MNRLLLLDDEPNVLSALQRTLKRATDHELCIETFTSPSDALLRCGEVDFDVVMSDYWMPEMNGIDFLQMVKGVLPYTVRVVLSASTEFSTVMAAINRAEIFRYLPKPWNDQDLRSVLSASMERRAALLIERRRFEEALARMMTPEELEAKRLEEMEPGITKVNWNPDGSISLD